MAVKTREFCVTIDKERCKGCMLCVAYCPRNVLAMQKTKAMVIDPKACIGCQLCEIYCPDFAISVSKSEEESNE